ncbi:MAG: TonB-dependent receptor, partial [candidate division KSB1 bacterium]|nr:TonB-dependent receptor [candidate division KSB1 bacterium]
IRFLLLTILPLANLIAGGITGRIQDRQTHQPLPGANIQVLGTLRGASSDEQGNFQIENLPPGRYSIRVSMIGYRHQTLEKIVVEDNRMTFIAIELIESPIEFEPIVVSAGKIEQRLDQAPVSMSVITAREIATRQPVNLIEALEMTPGLNFIGNQINIRGSTGYVFGAGNKVLLLLDGVPVYASDTGEFNWDMLPPLDIEQIEVVKGAGSALWGAAALGGVVNIITKSPGIEGKVTFSLKGGKYDRPYYREWFWTDHQRLFYTREDVNYSQRRGALGWRLSAGHAYSTGYTQLGDFTKYNLTTKLEYRFTNDIKWTGYAALSQVHRGFFVQWKGQNDPYQVDESNLNNYARLNQLTLYSRLTVPFSSRFALHWRGSLVRTLMGNQFGEGNDFNPAFGQGLELQTDWLPSPRHHITSGFQFQQDAGSTRYFGDHRGVYLSPYIQDQWQLRDNLRLTAGWRYDRYQLYHGPREDLFSPRVGLNWQPWATTSFRASAGSGFRAATIVERFLELSIMNFKIIANPELRAERAWAFDIGWRQYISSDWLIDLSLFDNEYDDLIEAHLDLIRGQIQFRNLARARIQGIEATASFSRPTNKWNLKIIPGCQASITSLHHRELEWNDPLPYRPDVMATIRASLQIGKFQWQTDYRYASKIAAVKIYPINERVPMKFVDMRLDYRINSFTLQLGVNNLLQYNYAPMESNLLPMRTFTAAISGGF